MKTNLLSLLVILPLFSYAQNVNIPDANFKANLLSDPNINTNSDTEIQVSEAQAFTGTIFATGNNIYDMTGLEAFTSLTGLVCAYNNFTILDVSANTALEDLRCSNNTLTNLDVSNNTNLQILNCAMCQLSSLDISSNTNLNFLNISGNPLSTLSLNNNILITALYVGYTSITNLDLSNLSVLEYLYATDMSLTSLILTNGNNSGIIEVHTENNPNLSCIEVDNVSYCNTNWVGTEFTFDSGITFSTDCSSTLNVNENNDGSSVLIVFPNPTSGLVTLQTNNMTSISLLDLSGKVLMTETISGNKNIDLSNFAKGIYFIRDNQSSLFKKIILE